MGFFLETLFGGLMVGTLYALIAIGFVLIFKASGVFNFAQGAMVLFSALTMARFSQWIPSWLGMEPGWLGNLLAIIVTLALMVVVAWVIERLALRHLVNQEPITLLMATLGIAYLLDGLGPMIFGSEVYKIDVGMPKDPIFIMDGLFPGGVMISLEDLYAAGIAAISCLGNLGPAVMPLGSGVSASVFIDAPRLSTRASPNAKIRRGGFIAFSVCGGAQSASLASLRGFRVADFHEP